MNFARRITRLANRKEEAACRQNEAKKRRLWQKTTAMTTAFALLANPMSALAAVVSGDAITTVTKTGSRYEVETSRRYGQNNQNAVNVFNEFGLNANEIANLYFGTKTDNSANNLFNFVNARIDVNGTVNAIKDNKIGGNLYFLSKEGMFVGAGGVINTGSLYVMTPAGSAGVDLLNEPYSYELLRGQFAQAAAIEGTEAYTRVVAANIPLNADASISVLGKINATNNIGLHAPKIAIGKNLLDGNAAIVTGAALKTGVVDFKDLVNTNGASGLADSALTVSRDADSGDIILAAKAEYANTLDQAFNNLGSALGLPNIDVPKTITASVESYGTIDAARDAKLTAEATNGNRDLTVELAERNLPAGAVLPDYVPIPAADAGNFAKTVARVEVQGAVKSGNDTILTANANNTYVDQGTGMNPISGFLGTFAGTLDASVMILGSEATVNIGTSGSVTAANNVDIAAHSILDGTAGLTVAGSPLVNLATAIPTAGVVYAKTDNQATVTVGGAVTSLGTAGADAGDKRVNIAATAEELVRTTGAVSAKKNLITGAKPSDLVASLAITDSDNHAAVTIDNQVKAEQGDVRVTAGALNTIITASAATAPDDSMASAAVNVLSHNSSATVNVNRTVTAGGSLTVDAANTILENTATASNAHGMSKLKAEVMNAVNAGGIASAAKGLIPAGAMDKLSFLKGSDSKSPLDNLFSAGAAVVVANEANTAGVKIAKTAGLQAAGDLKVNAGVLVQDTHMAASAKTSSYKDGSEKDVAIAAGVVYAGIDNSATVEIEGRDVKSDTVKLSGKNISITSGTVMEYRRVERILRNIERSLEQLNAAIDAIENMSEAKQEQYAALITRLKTIKGSLESCAGAYTADFKQAVQNPDSVTEDSVMEKVFNTAGVALGTLNEITLLQNEFGDLLNVTSPFTNTVNSALGVATNALAFAEPNNYANFSAGARAAGETQASIAGSVSITDINHTSRVLIGRNTELQATNKLELASENKISDVNITGKTQFWKSDAAGPGVGVGGSFNYQDFDTNSLVAVAEGAELTGGDVKLSSNNEIFHVGAMLSAGKSDGSAISGMVSFTNGESINAVSVDDEAIITAVKGAANQGAVQIAANNSTSVTNAILSFSAAGGSAGVGMGVAINDLDVRNIAAVADNGGKKAGGIEVGELFGSNWSESLNESGKITAHSFSIGAETTGLINAVSVAGGMTSSGQDEPKEEPGFFDKLKTPITKVENLKTKALGGISQVSNKLQGALNSFSGNEAQGGGATPPAGAEAGVPSFSVAGAGSVSLNFIDSQTKAVADGAVIELSGGKAGIEARDSAFIGAWSGAAAISKRKPDPNAGGGSTTSVAFAGAVGVNDINSNTEALLANSKIDGAGAIDVTAVSGGTQAAAGIAATVTKSSQGTNNSNYQGGASVSVNLLDRSVNANMTDVKVNQRVDSGDPAAPQAPVGGTDIDVTAYASDVQVTGGVTANLALSGGQVAGGSVTVADIKNTLNAGIKGGEYAHSNDAQVQSLLATTQVTAAIAVGVAAGGSSTNNVFSGAVVYNGLNNKADAVIDGAQITADGAVNVLAHDTKANSTAAKKYQDKLGSYNDHQTLAAERGLDTDGSSYYQDLDTSAADSALDLKNNQQDGSTIVTAALTVAGSSDNAAGAAVNVGNIDNAFSASIKNATITAKSAGAGANADTLLVSAVGGVAAGAKNFGGMGSVSWQTLTNNTKATIDQGTLTADSVTANARNGALAVNAAGQVTVGKGAAVGATLVYTGLDNITGAYIKGSELQAKDAAQGIDVTVNAAGAAQLYGIGASVAASPDNAAISGTVVINRGGNNTEAAIDKDAANTRAKLINADDIVVHAEDKTNLTAVVANVNASAKVAVGAGVAYNDIGGASADPAAAKQNVAARLDHADMTTVTGSHIDVTADDESEILTLAVGIGGSGKVAVQGAAATALINKNLSASMTDTNIDKDTAGANRATATVAADNQSDIYTGAMVVAAAGTAAVGAGVSVNRIQQDTDALVSGGKQNVSELLVTAKAAPSIFTVGMGGGVAGTAGIAGSVAVNMIENNTSAKITGDAVITAQNNIGLLAESDEVISNYAGVLTIGGTAAVGAAVSVNDIQGDTVAAIEGNGRGSTKVTALGKAGSVVTRSQVDDDEIVDAVITGETFDPTNNLKAKRQTESKTGLVIDASGTRNIRSALANLSGSGTAAVAVTANVNMIGGSTRAGISDALINGGSGAAAGGDVSVSAADYTNSTGFVGTAAGAGNVAAGLSSDTNIVDRVTVAKVSGSDIKAADLAIAATGKQGISSFGAGVAVAGQGAGIAGTVGVATLNARTTAELSDTEAAVKSLDVRADHLGRVNLGTASVGGAAIGAGVGLAVGVTDDSSVTEAHVKNSDVTSNDGINVSAANVTELNTLITSFGVAGLGAGVSGSVSVNNIHSQVNAGVSGGELAANTGDIDIDAGNTINIDAKTGGLAAGAAGVGASVSVNTLDSRVQATADNTKLTATAGSIGVTAAEQRDISQFAVNAAAGIGALSANIMVTNVGKALSAAGGGSDAAKAEKDAAGEVDRANSVYGSQDILAGDFGARNTGGSGVKQDDLAVNAGKGTDDGSLIKAGVRNGTLTAAKNIAVTATETDAIDINSGNVALGGISVNGSIGILNVHRNTAVEIDNAVLKAAEKIHVQALIEDGGAGTRLNMLQGTAGVYGLSAGYARLAAHGSGNVAITGSSLETIGQDSSITVEATDQSSATINALGLTAGLVGAGVIITDAVNDSSVTISIDDSNFTAKATNVAADKANTVTANAVGGVAGFAGAAVGVAATAEDKGISRITVKNGSEFSGDAVSLTAQNAPAVKANAGSAAVSLGGAGGASVAVAKAAGAANLSVLGNNSFQNNTVSFNAFINTQTGKATAQADAAGLAAAGIVGIGFNLSQAESAMDVNVTVDEQNYKDNTELTIFGRNETRQKAQTKGLTIGGVLAAGSNKAVTGSSGTTVVDAKGGTAGSVTVNAVGAADNTAVAGGSGGGLVSAGATVAENTMKSDAVVNLSGDWTVAGSLTANAGQHDTANLNADSVQAGLAAINGAKATNIIGNQSTGTAVNVLNGASLTAGDINLTAKNNIIVNNRYTHMVEGAGYGGLAVQNATVSNTINKKTAVKVGSADLTARTGGLTLAALTEGNVNSKASMKTGGLIAVVTAANTNTVAVNNEVNLADGSRAETKTFGESVTLAASDSLDVTAAATADNEGGAAGGSAAVMNNTLDRINTVQVAGAIRSMGDANLYAGTRPDGTKGVLNLDVAAEAYNKSVIPVAVPDLNSANKQSNRVIVAGDGAVDSVRHINLAANQGKEYVAETTATYTWYEGEDTEKSFTGTAAGKDSKSKQSDNYVRVDGKLTAGTQNKLTVTVDGRVAPPGGTITGGSPLTYTVSSGNADYDQELKGKIQTGTIDYGNELFARWQALGALISEYNGKEPSGSDLQAYVGLKAEQERVFNQMQALGLVTEETVLDGGTTKTVYNVIPGFDVHAIELPDLAASGGNIVIDSDTMTGSGSLTAKGAPEITITNNSSVYLKLNDVIIGDKGGEIKFNNAIITGDNTASNQAIKAINKDQAKPVNYTVYSDGPDGAAKIAIDSNWNTALEVTYIDPDDGTPEKVNVKPLTTIEINGAVENMHGKIAITNKGGDILIQTKAGKDNASVQGREIELSAVNGSVTQGYIDGIVNIGSSPEATWTDRYKEFLNYANALDATNPQHDGWATSTGGSTGGGSWIAGDSVYINAANINVNGLIQSGYDTYRATISQTDLNAAKNASLFGVKAVVINGETLIKINDGNKAVYDPVAGKYTYEVQAYYNPRTGKIVVDDIATKGGQVHLTGRIVSTGNGKITALDGGANITIVNDANADLQMGSIANNNVAGLIKITDLNTNTVTEYTRTQTKVSDLFGNNAATSGASSAYTVKSGLRYNWVKGSTTEVAKTYENKVKRGLWGLVKVGDTTELAAYEKDHSPVQDIPGDKRDKGSGAFIGEVTLKNISGTDLSGYDYVMVFDNVKTSESRTPVEHWTSRSGFLGWFKWDHYRWTVKTGSSQTYLNSVKADKAISIGFIGQTDGAINISGKQSVELLGDIRNNSSNATLEVIAGKSNTFGAITQSSGTIYGDNVRLGADSGINGIDITSLSDTVRLDVDNTTTGNVDIRVDGGWANNRQFKGNVDLVQAINAGSGDVSLAARGDITQQGANLTVQGSRIDLVSTHGRIGTDAQALVIRGGQNAGGGDSLSASVNAAAKGNINLTQDSGNMRVGTIDSAGGDVKLTVVNGSFVDALPTGETVAQDATDKKLQKWKDLGLIAGDGAFSEKRAQQAADYKNGVEADYRLYQEQKAYYNSHSDQQSGPAYAAYQELTERFAGFASADAYLAADAKYQDLTRTLTASDYRWTQDQLLYALQDAMINKEGGSTQTEIKAANISGNNVTLTANQGGIGIDTGAVTITDFSNVDNLKQLVNADASDVTWTKDANGNFASATINGKSPLGVHTRNDGVLNAVARENIYLAGRTEGQDTPLFVDKVTTSGGNIRVLGKAGVFSVNSDPSSPNFNGKDLILEGGAADIGAINNTIRTVLSGQLTARTDGSAYIRDLSGSGLTISSIYAGQNLWLRSDGNISSFYNAGDPDDPLNLGRIKARQIDIASDNGNVGTAGQGLRITNFAADDASAQVKATGKNVYLAGITAAGETGGVLVLTEVTATAADGAIVATSTDDLTLNGDLAAAGSVSLRAGTAPSTADAGVIAQQTGAITTDSLSATAVTGIELGHDGNTVNNVFLINGRNDILFRNAGTNGLVVGVSQPNDGAIAIENQTGALTVNTALTATGSGGDISLTNHAGGINAGTVTAGADVNLISQNGAINLTGDATAGNGLVLQATGGGITLANATANRQITIEAKQEGGVAGGNVTSVNDTVTVRTDKGAISLGDVSAGINAVLRTETGDIAFRDVTANQQVDIQVMQAGDITGRDVKAVNSTLTVHTVKGDVDLRGVYAARNASVGSDDGSVTMFSIDGENIIIQLKNKNKKLQVTDMIAAKDVIISSSASDIGRITQRPGYDNMLMLRLQAADSNSAMEYFNIGNVITRNGLQIDQLWTKRAEVNVDSRLFYIDKLSIVDVGHFSNDNTTVAVYGGKPLLDGSANVYFWYNPNRRDPWMYLNFMQQEHTLNSNGVLLHSDNYFHTYLQRLSGTEEMAGRMQQQMSQGNWERWQSMHQPATVYGHFGRFGLVDLNLGGLPQNRPLNAQTTGTGDINLF